MMDKLKRASDMIPLSSSSLQRKIYQRMSSPMRLRVPIPNRSPPLSRFPSNSNNNSSSNLSSNNSSQLRNSSFNSPISPARSLLRSISMPTPLRHWPSFSTKRKLSAFTLVPKASRSTWKVTSVISISARKPSSVCLLSSMERTMRKLCKMR